MRFSLNLCGIRIGNAGVAPCVQKVLLALVDAANTTTLQPHDQDRLTCSLFVITPSTLLEKYCSSRESLTDKEDM
jgi:hypothetical protein